MVEFQPSKLAAWVRFPSPAPNQIGALSSVDRVPGYEPVGRRFESCRARQKKAKSKFDLAFFIQAAGLAYHRRAKCGAYHQPLWGCISSRASVHLSCGLMIYSQKARYTLAFVRMIYRNKLRMIYTPSA